MSRISKKILGYEDLSPLIYINYLINGGKEFKDCSYLVIDEAQDLSLAQYYILKKMFSKAKFNIFGDVNQSIYDYQSIHDWNELNKTMFGSTVDILELNKSYRTTTNIFDASNLILRQLNQGSSECIARTGEELLLSSDISEGKIISQVKNYLDKGYQSIAIICKDDNETKNVYTKLKKMGLNITEITEKSEQYNVGLCIMPSYLSKGLEFDAVIIYDANNKKYSESDIDMKLLYVAITRAMHALSINYNGELAVALRPLIQNEMVLKKSNK